MNADKLQEILVKHKMYLDGNENGVCADLCNADLRGANLRNANLRGANLRNANLRDANLLCANLRNADLRGANLLCANLHNVDLRDANLLCANLCNADLRGANLRNVDLRDVNLHNANLCDADLRNADLLCANLYGAVGIISFGPIGKFSRIGYAVKHDNAIMVQLGCFWGTVEKAREAIRIKYGENSTYEALVIAAANVLSNSHKEK